MLNPYRKVIDEHNGFCHLCGMPYAEIHHVYGRANRNKSTKYGMLVPLCKRCHEFVHKDYETKVKLMAEYQEKFEKENPDLNFREVFGRNYK